MFRPSRTCLFLILSLAASVVSSTAFGQTDTTAGVLAPKGPIPHRNSEPLNTPFLRPQATDARVLGVGKARYDLHLDIVNNLLNLNQGQRKYVVDFEEQRLSFGYARGLGAGQELGINLTYISRNGGLLDDFIDGWHKIFGFKGGGRGNIASGRKLFQITDASGRTIVNDTSSRSGLGDTTIEYRYALSTLSDSEVKTRNIGLAARAILKLPTGNKEYLLGSGKTDVGFGLAATARPLRNLALHGNASLTFNGQPSKDNLRIKRTLTHTLIAAEYLFDGRTSVILQSDDNPAPFHSGFTYADRPRRAFTYGFWRTIGRGKQIYISNAENDFGALAKNAPDFVLSLGTRWSLQ